MKKLLAKAVVVVILVMAGTEKVDAFSTAYSQDFESGTLGTEWSGAGTLQSPLGLSVFGFGDWHLKSDSQSASILTLSGLRPHTSMKLSFSLAMWDSVDAHQGDLFQVKVDGNFIINEVFGNYVLTNQGQSVGPGVPLTPPFTGYYSPDYGNLNFRDSARAVSIVLAHSASSVTISFQYPDMQPPPDETFGIDNIVITMDCQQSADLSGDCFVDMADFALLATEWLWDDCVAPYWCQGADFDTSGKVGIEDLAELGTQWLMGVRQ
ncbi:MAG: hypothetical protein ACYC54_12665 [Sedimentisphaerales bacterium]